MLAFSDGIHGTVLVPAEVKRACQQELRTRGVKPGMIALRIFTAGILLLVEGKIHTIASVTIDTEYEGREGEIKGFLLRFIRRWVADFPKEAITFRQIGKRSPAHKLAWETHRGVQSPERVVTLEETLRYLLRDKKKSGGRLYQGARSQAHIPGVVTGTEPFVPLRAGLTAKPGAADRVLSEVEGSCWWTRYWRGGGQWINDRGELSLRRSVIEVDQSGRIEVLTVDTALGFSNDRQAAILIPAFAQIGRASRAHEVAWSTYRGERAPEKRVTLGELLKFC